MSIFNVNGREARARAWVWRTRLMIKVERLAARPYVLTLDQQFKRVAAHVRENETTDITSVMQQHVPLLQSNLAHNYRRAGIVFGELAVDQIGKGIAPVERKGVLRAVYWEAFDRWAQSTATRRVTEINKVTQRTLRRTIVNAVEDGKSFGGIADAIIAATQFNAIRALRIARTETHTAANFATREVVKSVGLQDAEKEWLSAHDERTRSDHRKADGQRRPMDEPYQVGGEDLMYPGDPDGSPENIINCRCLELYHAAASRRRR